MESGWQGVGIRYRRKESAFTLIELLIVIAIILILIAIALPNFLEAQIRARVTKAKGEIRTLSIAMEAYFLDWNIYPSYSYPNYTSTTLRSQAGVNWLTSPIAYITSVPEDPFPGSLNQEGGSLGDPPYSYVIDGFEISLQDFAQLHPHTSPLGGNLVVWVIYSLGPDSPETEAGPTSNDTPICNGNFCADPLFSYSATNGTKSRGDIFRYGGDGRWMGVFTPNLVADRGRYNSLNKPGQAVDGVVYLQKLPHHLSG